MFFFSSRRRHTRWTGDWSSDVCSSDLAGPVVDDKPDMAALDSALLVIRHPRHVDELVAHVDERAALAAAAQVEIEDLAIPVERLVDVADLDRHMVDADQPRLLPIAHINPPGPQDV